MIAIASKRAKLLSLGFAGAVAALALAGAGMSQSATAKPSPDKTAQAAQTALTKGKVDKAIELAEQLVAGNPREPAYRALLAQAYLKAGRFESAAATFDDAMKLGENSGRTALGFALANIGANKPREALAILDDWRDAIAPADLGLALALAGDTSRGVAILADVLRAGDASPKVRQNLAYAYALDGRWRDARVTAAMDVPADKLDARLSQWAERAKPEEARERIALLLSTPVRADPGRPAALALADNPPAEQLAAERSGEQLAAASPVTPPPAAGASANSPSELPAVGQDGAARLADYTPVSQPAGPAAASARNFAAAFAEPAPAAAPRAEARPSTTPAAVRKAAAPANAARAKISLAPSKGSHAVQLGSFASQQGARRAWGIFAAKNPELRRYKMVITPAKVRGRQFWRVAAAGFDGRSASGLCGSVKSRGGVCFAYNTSVRGATYAAKPQKPMLASAKPRVPAKAPAGIGHARRR